MRNPLESSLDDETLAMAIVNTIPEPFLVLDDEFRVMAAGRAFCETFRVDQAQTRGTLLFELGDGQWDIPALRLLLETIIPEKRAMDGFEVDHVFPTIGHRVMLLNARKVVYKSSSISAILLAFSDVTERRRIEHHKSEILTGTEELLRQQKVLLQEMQHRVANSLQIIAGILLMKARTVTSEETRKHLRDAHERVMSVAAIQAHLHANNGIDLIGVCTYLTTLCDSLGSSMVGEGGPIRIKVDCDDGKIESATAVSMGLIVTELVMNAIKYAFPETKDDALVRVTYESSGADWKLVVADNGVGTASADAMTRTSGLGTIIVDALVKQLDAHIEIVANARGRTVSVTRATFKSVAPLAA